MDVVFWNLFRRRITDPIFHTRPRNFVNLRIKLDYSDLGRDTNKSFICLILTRVRWSYFNTLILLLLNYTFRNMIVIYFYTLELKY